MCSLLPCSGAVVVFVQCLFNFPHQLITAAYQLILKFVHLKVYETDPFTERFIRFWFGTTVGHVISTFARSFVRFDSFICWFVHLFSPGFYPHTCLLWTYILIKLLPQTELNFCYGARNGILKEGEKSRYRQNGRRWHSI